MRSTARRYISLHVAAAKNDYEDQIDEDTREKSDAYRAILSSKLPDIEKEPDRVAQEVMTLLVGGSATTKLVMSRVMFHTNSTPHVLSHLRSELDAIMPSPSTHPVLEVLEQQRYLVRTENFLIGPMLRTSVSGGALLFLRTAMTPFCVIG